MHNHKPVLLAEAIRALHIKKNARYIDATLGAGGHSIEILSRGGAVLGIEADAQMIKVAKKKINTKGFVAAQGNFKDILDIANSNGYSSVSGVLYDLGVSSLHYKKLKRGFSFDEGESALDMRLDPSSQEVRAADVLNLSSRDKLVDMFLETMSAKGSRKLTARVAERRKSKHFSKVKDFVEIVGGKSKIGPHPATKPFLALRMEVNSELENLSTSLAGAFKLLKPEGHLVVISFHSGEDRVVKKYFKNLQSAGSAEIETKSPITASQSEVKKNRLARSAKLRSIKKNEKN